MIPLTIAIPTYNRPESLNKTLEVILPQFTSECRLLIIDNNSDSPVSSSVESLLKRFPQINVEIIRNGANIGGNANVLRCFEYCKTEWMWLLSDDDLPHTDAIQTIYSELGRHPEVININFSTNFRQHSRDLVVKDIRELLSNSEVDILVLISTNIYKVSELKKHLSTAYLYTYSWVPQFAITLLGVLNGGSCYLSLKQIVAWYEAPKTQSYASTLCAIGLPSLLDIPMDYESRLLLAQRNVLSPERLLRIMMAEAIRYDDRRSFQFQFRSLAYRNYGLKFFFMRIRAAIYSLLFYFPPTWTIRVANLASLFFRGRTLGEIPKRDQRI